MLLLLYYNGFTFGLIRIADPEIVEVLRLKYFDVLQKKYPRSTDGQTYSVIVDIDEKSLREIGQWPWPRTVLADLLKNQRKQVCLSWVSTFCLQKKIELHLI